MAEAWAAGTLSPYAAQVPEHLREAWLERVGIMMDAGMSLVVAEQAALLRASALW